MSSQAKTPRRGRRVPTSLALLLAIIQLDSSSFVARAQYVPPRQPQKRGGWPHVEVVGTDIGGRSEISKVAGIDMRPVVRDVTVEVAGVDIGRRDQASSSREIVLNSYSDFCIFGPPDPFNQIWSSERNVVSWCSQDGHGTRLIPDGTLHGVTFVKTDNWVQVSGYGDFTKINVAPGDMGGQFDSSHNTPDGTSVSASTGTPNGWVTLISATTFCFRACIGDAAYCPSEYDQMGCWFLTGNAVGPEGTYQDCVSDQGDPPGMLNGQKYNQGDQPVPDPTSPELRDCQPGPSPANGQAAPPMHDWEGHDNEQPQPAETGAPEGSDSEQGDAAATGDANDHVDPGSQEGEASTTWLPVETCVPCEGGGGAFSTASGPASVAVTEQVGVTQVQKEVGAVATDGASSPGPTAAPTSLSLKDSLHARQEGGDDQGETITKDGQCCHTTWTPSVVGGGGAGPTATSSAAEGGASAGGVSRAGAASATASGVGETLITGGGGATAVSNNGSLPVPSGGTGTNSTRASGSLAAGNGTVGTNGTLHPGNGTASGGNRTGNGTGNDTSGAIHLALVGVEGSGKLLMSLLWIIGLGALTGGWSIV